MAAKPLVDDTEFQSVQTIPGVPVTVARSADRAAGASHLLDASRQAEPCCTCFARSSCHAARLMAISPGNFSTVHLYSRSMSCGEHVFFNGDQRKYVYFIRTGSIKSCLTSAAGDEHVVSFHLPGELLGLNAMLGKDVHKSSTIALEGTELCAIPAAQLLRFVEQTPGGIHWLLGLAGEEISRCYLKQLMLNKMNAETRLSHFLLDLSKRFHERGCSANEFNLSMSREDIANHLGMALETVSRLLSRFQQDGLLAVKCRRRITIRDAASLAARQIRIVA